MTYRRLIHILLAFLILVSGFMGMKALSSQKKQLKKKTVQTSAPSVETLTIATADHQVVISGQGTVTPLKEIGIIPQVGGKVTDISPSLVNGGAFKKDDMLIRIDPADYELAVTMARAGLKAAESALMLAHASSNTAREEWELHEKDRQGQNEKPSDLVLKKPQLLAAQAKLEAEKANLDKALLNLERTTIRAPFSGKVSQKSIDAGQVINAGQAVATIFSDEAMEISVPLSNEDLFWFHTPGFSQGDQGADVDVTADFSGQTITRQGKVDRVEATVNPRTRMPHVVVRVDQPYETSPPLVPGIFATVAIHGETLKNACFVPRNAIHENNMVWGLDDENSIVFLPVTIARMEQDLALITKGIENGQVIVTSRLKVVSEGMKVVPFTSTPSEEK